MKISRIVSVVLLLVLCGGTYVFLTKNGQAATVNDQNKTEQAVEKNDQSQEKTVAVTSPAQQVKVLTLRKGNVAYLELLGTVRANDQVKISPIVTGQIKSLRVNEGDSVKAGDVLFEIGGMDQNKALAQTQLEIAQTNYKSAKKSLANTLAGNESSLRLAQLQLDSAKNQAESASIDVQGFDQNIGGLQQGAYLLQNSFDTSHHKNELDLEKTQSGIDDLRNAIDDLENQRQKLTQSLEEQMDSTADSQKQASLEQQLTTQQADLDKKIDDLYKQLDTARNGYQSLEDVGTLTENQVLGQLVQSKTQAKALYLTQQSLEKRLGLSDDSSDSVRLAEENLNAMAVKNSATATQVQAQVDLAKLNLELAQAQADGLKVKTPIDGIVGEVMVHMGDQVGPQVVLTQIIGTQNFELKVAVNAEDADKIPFVDTMAEVKIGGRYMEVPIKSVSAIADPNSKLVNVTLALPKIFFRANQTLKAKIPVKMGQGESSENTFFIPLDAVIIGTEEQYVFVAEDGKAIKKNVKLGTVYGDQVQILNGLNPTDTVIVEGAKNLIDGQAVEIAQKKTL